MNLDKKQQKDLRVLTLFTAVYCEEHHKNTPKTIVEPGLSESSSTCLCADCNELLLYGFKRRQQCPLDPKPSCKHCPVHCYRPGHREKIREIMRFSGKKLLCRGRLDLLWHYFF